MLENNKKNQSQFCSYFQASIDREQCWKLTAILRSYEHLAFDRTLDVEKSIFEFFVPPLLEDYFVELMQLLIERGIVRSMVKLENRLMSEAVL